MFVTVVLAFTNNRNLADIWVDASEQTTAHTVGKLGRPGAAAMYEHEHLRKSQCMINISITVIRQRQTQFQPNWASCIVRVSNPMFQILDISNHGQQVKR
jgi:hypothetical protein